MSFLLKWLRPETSSRIGLRPHRNVELPLAYDAAYDRVLEAIEVTLGANVNIDDRKGRFIEAGFGLVNNERIRISFDAGPDSTQIHIEAAFPAGAKVPEKSAAVDALAHTLESGIAP
ncbi:MAG TPA: hypothetical protein VFN49_00235 [Candidatus Aquilonibacter sp.]|nr:hypothetical protein [Candidatus Aquilonibacter sp.]